MPSKTGQTQQQRRQQTRQAVLDSARQCFAARGYQDTSLDDIAAACQLTTRPVYHYFGSKQGLFEAVATELENRLADAIAAIDRQRPDYLQAIWQLFITTCKQTEFRRIVLLEAPLILGRQRWQDNNVVDLASGILRQRLQQLPPAEAGMIVRMALVALAEAALMIAEADDSDSAIEAANRIAERLLALF